MKKDYDIASITNADSQRMAEAAEDMRVVSVVLDGNVNAYRKLVEKYQTAVFNLILRMTHKPEEAAELTQEVFVKAYEALATFRSDHKFFSWVYRIAINTTLNYLKKRSQYLDISAANAMAAESEQGVSEAELLMQAAVAKLPEKHKAVVILKYYEQLSYKDVAFSLQITEKKVRSRLFEARMKIKTYLEETHYFDHSIK